MNSDLKCILKELNQEHLIEHYNSLNDNEKSIFLNDLSKADFNKLALAFNQDNKNEYESTQIESQEFSTIDDFDSEELLAKGLSMISEGKSAVLIMSGGMGSRLGFDAPKGAFILANNKSIFEIHIDKLHELYKKTNYYSYLLIMCSELNYEETVDYFEKNDYFDYPKDKVKFFKQANIPACDENNKVLLASKTSIKQVPDGNGGIFDALSKSGLLALLKKEGVKWLQVAGVDNVLLKVLDPYFIAFAENSGYDIASKSVKRVDSTEKVGLFAIKNNHPAVIEYGEVPEELLEKKINGDYYLSEGNIACHLFNIKSSDFDKNTTLPFHKAHKKIEYYQNENIIIPDSPNAYKYEQFIFDAFSKFNKMAVLRVDREKEFSPLKNKEGKDSIQSARDAYLKSLLGE